MKINKSILTGMTALSLFATSAAAATSAVTPIVSNASAKKEKLNKYIIRILSMVKSKGHATHYYQITGVYRSPKSNMIKKGAPFTFKNVRGYSLKNKKNTFKLRGNRIVRVNKGIPTYISKSHKAIKDSSFKMYRNERMLKTDFNAVNKELTR